MSEGLELVNLDEQDEFEPPAHWRVDSRWLVRSGDRMRLQFCEMAPGGGAESHEHEAEEQVFWVMEGALRVDDGGGMVVDVSANQALRIPPGVSHATVNAGDVAARYLVLTYPGATIRA